ncbi:arabinose transporter [Ideonella azotifigens]|uniref:Uncharacterized MFS-type transporter GCM10009107_60800 n=2 Tax=Ideonella azotifigens TaxID=513160 RepID=A0ABP3VYD6_9BURK|nr:arabinose transporter [Ideonella azotifigens]MCD2339199.1 arabinose transporter [Ideonella azotifigens]
MRFSSFSTDAPAQRQLLLLTALLFVAYLCVGMALPVVPVFVTGRLGLGHAWAGLAVGIAFLATILTRGHAGSIADRRSAKLAVSRGLLFYIAGALASMAAGMASLPAVAAFAVLVAGRLLLGLGESLVAVGVIAWGIGLVGPARSGQVLALVGAAIYAALAVGGPLGLVLQQQVGFAGAMAASALLPALGWLAVRGLPVVAVPSAAQRPSLRKVLGQIWAHGLVVCLQGIGFAAIGAFFSLSFLDRHWPHAGLGLTAFGAGFVLVRVLFGRLPDRIGGLPVAIGSLVVETLGQGLIWQATTPALALAGAFLTGLGCSMIFPAMGREVVQRVAPPLRGTAMGGFSAFQDLAYGLTGPLAGLLADSAGLSSVYLVGCLAAAAGLLVALWLRLRESAQAR